MEAVFTRDVRGLFSPPTTSKAFYFPTTPRATSRMENESLTASHLTTMGCDRPNPQTNFLAPYPPITLSSHLSQDSIVPIWDVKLCPPCPEGVHGKGGEEDTDISDGSSKFNESWPSRSEPEISGNVVTHGDHDVDVVTHGDHNVDVVTYRDQNVDVVTHGDQDGYVGVSNQDAVNSERGNHEVEKTEKEVPTLAQYIYRFRSAPPSSRASRCTPSKPFWWREPHSGDVKTTPPKTPQDTSTPNTVKSCSHVSPSPRVSSIDASLISRSQDLLEKSSSLLTTANESLPAQKYLNTLWSTAPVVPSAPQQLSSRHRILEGSQPYTGNPSDDILAQWRFRRKLEQARQESAALSKSKRYSGKRCLTEVCQYQNHSHPEVSEQKLNAPFSHLNELCEEKSACVCYDVSPPGTGRQRQLLDNRLHQCKSRVKPLIKSVCERQVQTSPELLEERQVQTMLGQRDEHISLGYAEKREEISVERQKDGICEQDVILPTPCPPTTIDANHLPTVHNSKPHNQQIDSLNDGSPPSQHPLPPSHSSPYQVENPESEDTSVYLPTHGKQSLTVEREHISRALPIHDHISRSLSGDDHLSRAAPTHGGLALRDLTLSEDEGSQLTMTFTTELDKNQCSNTLNQQTHIQSTPIKHRLHHKYNDKESPQSSVPFNPSTSPCGWHEAGTSKEVARPLQKMDSYEEPIATGVPWDCHMDDELLRLLITKARLFEGQIREIDGCLMALQGQEQ